MSDLAIGPLRRTHDRKAFASGEPSLDRYLARQASQDVRRLANGVYVLTANAEPEMVLGYYTLAATSVPFADMPESLARHLPRYPLVSATLLGRLAVAEAAQERGFGRLLLLDAMRRSRDAATSIGACVIVVDALNGAARSFYAAHGFARLSSDRLIYPLRSVTRAFGGDE